MSGSKKKMCNEKNVMVSVFMATILNGSPSTGLRLN